MTEDLFEGWLSVPGIEEFLGFEPSPSPSPSRRQDTQDGYEGEREMIQGIDQLGHWSASPPAGTAIAHIAVRKRRGHTKSRLGCIACKRRKVKCQETWPSCANCIRRGCPCRYPVVFKHAQHDRIASEVLASPRRYAQVSHVPMQSTYNANDMRLFHHYLIAAHPCIPYEYEAIWVRDIPAFSHQYDYLMHGMLAMAGSHLDLYLDDSRENMALVHRQKAIRGLEEAFTRWPPQPHEAHVMLATSYLLAFQSSYMADGMLDHILSLRGCAILSQMIVTHKIEGAFTINPDMHGTWYEWKMNNFPALDQGLARDALHSLATLAPYLAGPKATAIERAVLTQTVECVRPLLVATDDERASSIEATPGSADTKASPMPSAVSTALTHSVPLMKNPLFPSELAPRFEDIESWDAITQVSPTHRPDGHRTFNALMNSLLILTTWPCDQVMHLMSPSNKVGNVVMAHFCCVRFIVSPLAAPDSAMKTPMKALVEWCERVVDAVEDDEEVQWTKLVEWPQKILTTMRCCVNQNSALTFQDLYDVLVNDPSVFREGRLCRL